jgi:hypothetical protein
VRRGTILILVSGLSAILAALAFGFLSRMRIDGEEAAAMVGETQARIMLYAALSYVQEGSRLGWDDPATPEHEESYGWVDVRDGRTGPCGRHGEPLASSGAFPAVGHAARCVMQVMKRPPFAVSLDLTPNPMVLDPTLPWNRILNRTNPDPVPAVADPLGFSAGDRSPRFPAQAWFRVFRKAPAVFILTCGAGATRGWRTYDDAIAAGEGATFIDRSAFDALRDAEHLLWYEVEWTAAVAGNTTFHYTRNPAYGYQLNEIGHPLIGEHERLNSRQFGGTFTYIERLREMPPNW